jgi:hypothetical protein
VKELLLSACNDSSRQNMRILNLCKEEMSIELIQASQELVTVPLTATR